ncbi:MAG: hypothetical protein ACPLYF_02410, partial [Fervidobacterium sp.]
GFLSGQYVSSGYYSQFVVHILGLTQFVYLIDYEKSLYEYYLPIPPKASGPYDLTFSDPQSGEVIYSETHTEIPEPGSPFDLGISTDVATRPYPIDAMPFRVIPYDIPKYRGTLSNARIRYEIEFGSPSKLSLIASFGTFEYVEGEENRAKIEIGGSTIYADIMPDGSFVYETNVFSSGDFVKVYDRDGNLLGELDKIPEKDITQGLTLKVRSGNLSLSVGEPHLGKVGSLYTSSISALNPLLFDYKILSQEESLSGKAINSGEVLFLVIEGEDVDVKDEIKITFDRGLYDLEIKALNDINSEPSEGQPSVELKEKDGGRIPIYLTLSGRRVLSVIPKVGLSSG